MISWMRTEAHIDLAHTHAEQATACLGDDPEQAAVHAAISQAHAATALAALAWRSRE